jgi:hypothetical protein
MRDIAVLPLVSCLLLNSLFGSLFLFTSSCAPLYTFLIRGDSIWITGDIAVLPLLSGLVTIASVCFFFLLYFSVPILSSSAGSVHVAFFSALPSTSHYVLLCIVCRFELPFALHRMPPSRRVVIRSVFALHRVPLSRCIAIHFRVALRPALHCLSLSHTAFALHCLSFCIAVYFAIRVALPFALHCDPRCVAIRFALPFALHSLSLNIAIRFALPFALYSLSLCVAFRFALRSA